MTQGSAHPPKARLVLRVGVTGHRPNKLGSDVEAIRAKVRDVIGALEDNLAAVHAEACKLGCYKSEPPLLRIISSLAEGADQIAAMEAMALGAELQVVLPFAKQEYKQDFATDASKEVFRKLHARATAVMALDGPGVRSVSEDKTAKDKDKAAKDNAARDRAYRAAGLMMLRQSDVVIAVWDGEAAESDAGTGAIAADALRLGLPGTLRRCSTAGVRPSMGSVRDAYDHAMAESFFDTLGCKLLDRRRFKTQAEARIAVFEFIEGFYNPRLRHSSLGYLYPINCERWHDQRAADPSANHRSAVLGTVKVWPGDVGACVDARTTAEFDRLCARRRHRRGPGQKNQRRKGRTNKQP